MRKAPLQNCVGDFGSTSHWKVENLCISKRALQSNVPSSLVPGTFLKHFRGERGCPWYGPSAHPGRHFATRTLRYKRAFGAGTKHASLDLFLGILGARGTVPGWHLVRYLCETRKALHERHVWKTLRTTPNLRRRTNVQQLTCKIDLSISFYCLFFSFVLIELKPLVLKGKVLGEKVPKSAKKCEKV